MGGRLSGLTTRGRCLLAGGAATAVCAVVLDERDLLRIGVFAAVLPLLALLLAAQARRSVRARREIVPDRLPVGLEATVTVRLSGGPLLGTMRLVDTVPDAAGAQPAAPPRFTVHRLAPRAGRGLTYRLRPVLRGVHRVGPLHGRTTDPLGLAEYTREIAAPDRLLVLPRVVALRGSPPALGVGDGAQGAALAHQGQGTSDVLVRGYRQGDDLRRVHWRSTARHDELMVRLEERPWRGGVTVLLDRRDSAHRGHGPASSLESAVELVASICAHLDARGEPVSLVTEDGTDVTGGHGGGVEPVLDALAAVRPSARSDLAGPTLPGTGDVIAVLGATGPGEVEELLARRASRGFAVLLDVSTWETDTPGRYRAAPAAAALRRAGWHVTVATAGSPPDRVWDGLVHGTPLRLGAGAP